MHPTTLSRRRTAIAAPLVAGLLLAACGGAPTAERRPIYLVERFDEGLVEPQPTAIEQLERTEWVFAEGAEWEVVQGVEGATVTDGALSGIVTSSTPVLELEIGRPRGVEDRLHSVLVRALVSAGTTLSATTLDGERPATSEVLERTPPGPLALETPLLPGEEMRTYTILTARNFPMGHPLDRSSIERVLLRPGDEPGARFEIESVRLVFRKEYLATVPSGIGWYGLGEIYHETMVTRSPETVRFRVELPPRPWLDLAIGTIELGPVRFRVEVAEPGEPSGEPVLLRTVTTPERWEPARIELGPWAGRSVDLLFRTEAGERGTVALWGTAVIRSALPPPAERSRPQGVIVFLGDTLRRDHLQPYGYERPNAPTLARLASEGALFLDAISQGTWTKVSVPSIFASAHPATSGVRDFVDRLPASAVTLGEALREAGYATFATSSVPFSGQLSNLQQGIEQLHESASVEDDHGGSKTARPLTDRMLDWIEQHRDVPFYAFLHAMDPHSPYEPRPPFNSTWFDLDERDEFRQQMEEVKEHIDNPIMRRFGMPSREELLAAEIDPETYVGREKDWYDGSILGMDAEIQRIMDRLTELGLADDVIFVFLADHGEEFLEHGNHWHGLNAYGENSNIPLVFWAPGRVPPGVTVEATVQALDVMPTILDLAGLEIPALAQGQSLVPLMRAAAEGVSARQLGWEVRPAISERFRQETTAPSAPGVAEFNYYAMVSGDWKLVRRMEPHGTIVAHELYDHRADPLDQNDLAAEHPEVVEELSARLDRWLAWAEENRLPSDEEAIEGMSAAELERLRSLGYVQ